MLLTLAAPLLLALARPVRRAPQAPLLPDREVTWSNPQGTSLTQIADDVWLAERPFFPRLPGLQGTDVACKAAVVRLPDGGLWVHAPVGLDQSLREALASLGPVKHIVTPNMEHQKFAPLWFVDYPEASSYACPGLREKKPELGWQRSLEELLDARGGLTSSQPPAEWGGAIDLCWIRDKIPLTPGFPFFNEVVFCHRASKTLIVTDLWWNYPASGSDTSPAVPDVPLSSRLWKAGMDRIYTPVYNGLMDGDGTRATSYDTVLGWDWDYIAPCHGEPVAQNAKAVLRAHLNIE